MWLPPGGHIEENELPDDAAVREVMEETGIAVTLIGEKGLTMVNAPRQLVTPKGIQVERITASSERHEHIDLIYFAVPAIDLRREKTPTQERVEINFSADEVERGGWFQQDEIVRMDLAVDVREWSMKALQEVPKFIKNGVIFKNE